MGEAHTLLNGGICAGSAAADTRPGARPVLAGVGSCMSRREAGTSGTDPFPLTLSPQRFDPAQYSKPKIAEIIRFRLEIGFLLF